MLTRLKGSSGRVLRHFGEELDIDIVSDALQHSFLQSRAIDNGRLNGMQKYVQLLRCPEWHGCDEFRTTSPRRLANESVGVVSGLNIWGSDLFRDRSSLGDLGLCLFYNPLKSVLPQNSYQPFKILSFVGHRSTPQLPLNNTRQMLPRGMKYRGDTECNDNKERPGVIGPTGMLPFSAFMPKLSVMNVFGGFDGKYGP